MVKVDVTSMFGKSIADQQGKIDTGADGTAIPENFVEPLELEETGKVWVKDANGGRKRRSTYDIFIKIGTIQFDLLQVSANPRDNILIGRDLINLWSLKLDGRTQKGELVPWSTDPNDVR